MSFIPPPTIAEAAALLREGKLTSTELTTGILSRVQAFDEALGAYVSTDPPAALEQAARADAELAAGNDRGPLHGIPVAVKDVIATSDAPTTAGSRVAHPAWRFEGDATVVARLRNAGAVLVGKSSTSEFAFSAFDPALGFPTPRNPWDLGRSPGASSSGSAVAVAAGLALGAIGTDTGGSIRFPAAATGLTGLKPTNGYIPSEGVVPLAPSLDTVGPIARTAVDCGLLLQAIAGTESSGDGDISGISIGMPTPYFFDAEGIDTEVLERVVAAIDVLRESGASVSPAVIAHADEAKHASQLTLVAEGFAFHRNSLRDHWGEYGRFARLGLARAALLSASDYAQAQRFRAWFTQHVSDTLRTHEVLVTPTWPTTARRLEEASSERVLLGPSFTPQWNFAGLPAIAVPCGFSGEGLPISMQLIGRPRTEGTLLKVAQAFQARTHWHRALPPDPSTPMADG